MIHLIMSQRINIGGAKIGTSTSTNQISILMMPWYAQVTVPMAFSAVSPGFHGSFGVGVGLGVAVGVGGT